MADDKIHTDMISIIRDWVYLTQQLYVVSFSHYLQTFGTECFYALQTRNPKFDVMRSTISDLLHLRTQLKKATDHDAIFQLKQDIYAKIDLGNAYVFYENESVA